MLKSIYSYNGIEFIESVEAEPICGVDFCDSCGDCLSCYGGDPCCKNEDRNHRWIEYQDAAQHGVQPTAPQSSDEPKPS